VPYKSLILVDKDGNEVTRSGRVNTPEGISSQDVAFASPGSFNVRVEKIKDTNEIIRAIEAAMRDNPANVKQAEEKYEEERRKSRDLLKWKRSVKKLISDVVT
jgi:hypothetical protein